MRAGCQQPDYMHCHPTGGAFYQTDDVLETQKRELTDTLDL